MIFLDSDGNVLKKDVEYVLTEAVETADQWQVLKLVWMDETSVAFWGDVKDEQPHRDTINASVVCVKFKQVPDTRDFPLHRYCVPVRLKGFVFPD